MFPQYRNTPSLRSRNDAAATPQTPQFRIPPEWRPGSSDASSNPSLQRAPRPVAQLFQSKRTLHSFAGRRKLPGGIVLDVFVFANLRLPLGLALDATLHVRSVLERSAELFFLLHAMRTPPGPVHLHAALRQTAREGIVLVLHAVAEIVGQPERRHDQHCIDRDAPPIPARSLDLKFFFSPFPSFLRHGILISRPVETGLAPSHTTTRSADGSTSIARHSSVSTSPSTITSTGPSSWNSTRRTACRSASGCRVCVPS